MEDEKEQDIEARAAAALRHPSIVTIHDILTDGDRPWIVMELVEGVSLHDTLRTGGPLPADRVAQLGRQITAALAAAHRRGVLHRDIKPANILLDGDRVVLTDFGIAMIEGGTVLTATNELIGSAEYIAPERVQGQEATRAADLWSVGVTLYAAADGRSPFARSDIHASLLATLTHHPDPPRTAGRLWPVVEQLLRKDPAERPTAEQALHLLTDLAGPAPGPAPGPATTAPAAARRRQPRPMARRRTRAETAEAGPPAATTTTEPHRPGPAGARGTRPGPEPAAEVETEAAGAPPRPTGLATTAPAAAPATPTAATTPVVTTPAAGTPAAATGATTPAGTGPGVTAPAGTRPAGTTTPAATRPATTATAAPAATRAAVTAATPAAPPPTAPGTRPAWQPPPPRRGAARRVTAAVAVALLVGASALVAVLWPDGDATPDPPATGQRQGRGTVDAAPTTAPGSTAPSPSPSPAPPPRAPAGFRMHHLTDGPWVAVPRRWQSRANTAVGGTDFWGEVAATGELLFLTIRARDGAPATAEEALRNYEGREKRSSNLYYYRIRLDRRRPIAGARSMADLEFTDRDSYQTYHYRTQVRAIVAAPARLYLLEFRILRNIYREEMTTGEQWQGAVPVMNKILGSFRLD